MRKIAELISRYRSIIIPSILRFAIVLPAIAGLLSGILSTEQTKPPYRSNQEEDNLDARTAALSVVVAVYIYASIRTVRKGNEALVERFGQYVRTLKPGLNFVIPLMDKVVTTEVTSEQILQIESQLVLTNDGFTLQIGALVFWRITDIVKAYYDVKDVRNAFKSLIQASLQRGVAQLSLKEVFHAKEKLNSVLIEPLKERAKYWGIEIEQFVLENIILSSKDEQSISKSDQLTFYQQQSTDLKEIVSLLANRSINVEVNATAESKAMNESTDQSTNYGGISQNVSGGNVYGGMQAAQGNNNEQVQEIHSIASSEQGLTQEKVIELLAQLESVLRQPDLPGEVQAKATKYLDAAKEEVTAKEPDKQLAAGNLKRMAETIETTSKTMESGKKIWETTKPILGALLPWLGVAKGFFGF